jgi:branched-chain amino acid aminotransferase
MAGIHAKRNNLHDCLLLNTHERICDSTIANLFIIKDNIIYTPPLTEGCVAGVARRWILENSTSFPFPVIEKPITKGQVFDADEIFLTNAVRYINWVKQFGTSAYQNHGIQLIQQRFNDTIY